MIMRMRLMSKMKRAVVSVVQLVSSLYLKPILVDCNKSKQGIFNNVLKCMYLTFLLLIYLVVFFDLLSCTLFYLNVFPSFLFFLLRCTEGNVFLLFIFVCFIHYSFMLSLPFHSIHFISINVSLVNICIHFIVFVSAHLPSSHHPTTEKSTSHHSFALFSRIIFKMTKTMFLTHF